MSFVIKATDSERNQGYIQYPGVEYHVVELVDATHYPSKREAESTMYWFNRRGGIFSEMKVIEIIDWMGHCKTCKTYYRPIYKGKKWYSVNIAYPHDKTEISRPKCCCPNPDCRQGEFNQEAI